MSEALNPLADSVRKYCALIGQEPLLVQGAGGNVSWKEENVLWVKASGTWLAEALDKDIFVPADLTHLLQSAAAGNFSETPRVVGGSKLRPSIETFLHAIMPHKVVVHVHSVEALAYLIRVDPVGDLQRLLGDSVKWVVVDYFKPGAELAAAVSGQINSTPGVEVVFMRSHGIVIGGADIARVAETMDLLRSRLKALPNSISLVEGTPSEDPTLQALGYVPCREPELNQLALLPELASRLHSDWALFPDHVVFLGAEAAVLGHNLNPSDLSAYETKPPYLFVPNKGVYESQTLTPGQKAQLRCYYDVLVRQAPSEKLASLSAIQIAELLNWDAEKYRKSLVPDKGAP